MHRIIIASIILIVLVPLLGRTQTTVNVNQFELSPGLHDATPALLKALESCKQHKAATLVFPTGEYHFYGDFGVDKYCFISNNDEGLKRIIFPIFEMDNLTIDGQGSSFIFHGFVNPFVIDHSKHISLKNFSIDFDRPFHSEAIILANREDGVDVEIPENFPYKIKNSILEFINGISEHGRQTTVSKNEIYPYGHMLEFDTKKRETAFMAKDYYLGNTPLVAEDLGGRRVRIFLKGLKGTVGNTLTFGPANRNYPGFTVSDCSDIGFQNISIHHSGGMGIIGQRTRNITVDHCKVTPSPGRMISTTADATHFVNCTGKIELSHCLFENQKDDATNIHGIYTQITKQISPIEVIVQLKHEQQLGFDYFKEGVEVEFVNSKSMITQGTAKVIEAERLNKNYTRVVFSDKIPVGIGAGDAIAELRDFPFVHIHDNIIRKNRARGMLLNCRGKTVVENNYFHSPGAALLFEGDAMFWFEQGGVSNCEIKNNVFDNCLFGVWGNAIIDVKAGIKEGFETSRYNKNIKITGNTFRTFDDALLLNIYCVDGLIWKNNKIEKTNDYPATRSNDSLFKVEYSDNVQIIE